MYSTQFFCEGFSHSTHNSCSVLSERLGLWCGRLSPQFQLSSSNEFPLKNRVQTCYCICSHFIQLSILLLAKYSVNRIRKEPADTEIEHKPVKTFKPTRLPWEVIYCMQVLKTQWGTVLPKSRQFTGQLSAFLFITTELNSQLVSSFPQTWLITMLT